jgi:chromosome segregation ATPase
MMPDGGSTFAVQAAEISTLQAKVNALTSQLSASEALATTAQASATRAREDFESEVRRHAATKAEMTTLREQLASAQSDQRRAQDQLTRLTEELAKANAQIHNSASATAGIGAENEALKRRVSELETQLADVRASQALKMNSEQMSLIDDKTKQAATEHVALLDAAMERRRRQVAETLSLYEYAHSNVETLRARALTERDRMEQKTMLAAHRASVEATVHAVLQQMPSRYDAVASPVAAGFRPRGLTSGSATPTTGPVKPAPLLPSPSSLASPWR